MKSEYTREYKKQGFIPILDWKAMPMTRINPKINRNKQCPCSSGKKYKLCCMVKLNEVTVERSEIKLKRVARMCGNVESD